MSSLRTYCRLALYTNKLNPIIYTGERGIKRWVAPTLREINRRKAKLGPQPELRRSNFLDWNYKAELFAFSKRLSENFDKELLQQAFTQRSYIIQEEQKQRQVGIEDPQLNLKDNRDLAEEGKYLTSMIVKCYLRQALPRLPEEGVVALHDYLMSDEVVSKISLQIGTKDIILSPEYPPLPESLINTFFAIVAVLSRSSAVVRTANFVRDFLIATLSDKDITAIWEPSDVVGILNDILKRENRGVADYRLAQQSAVNTVLSTYVVAVYSDKQFLGIGGAESVNEAKHVATLDALRRMFGVADHSRPIPFHINVDIAAETKENLPLTKWCSANLKNLVEM